MFETLQYVAEDGIGVLTLNRPERLNAVNTAMANELEALARQLRDEHALRALIVKRPCK